MWLFHVASIFYGLILTPATGPGICPVQSSLHLWKEKEIWNLQTLETRIFQSTIWAISLIQSG
jgi:hypothetical protein